MMTLLLGIHLCAALAAGAIFNALNDLYQHPLSATFDNEPGCNERESRHLNEKTKKFSVNGTGIPNVSFDVGESYAGLLPLSPLPTENSVQELFFWFFPSEKPSARKEIVIWLTGGPGCSSIGELLQENGPVSWKPGTYAPVRNPWSWHRLSNVIWVDQPVGTGFSRGPVTATDEHDVASQFLGFWRNFVDTFDLKGYKIFIAGSSSAGLFCPYIASAMLDAEDKDYFDLEGMMIFDPAISQRGLGEEFGVMRMLEYWGPAFTLNETARKAVKQMDDRCGYSEYVERYLTFPPSSVQPTNIPGAYTPHGHVPQCSIRSFVETAEKDANPCFSPFNIFRTCPLAFDPIAFTENRFYYPASEPVYFDRRDVKAAINAPLDREWRFCSREPVFVNGTDNSDIPGPGSQPKVAHVAEKTRNVIIGHGLRDMVLQSTGALLGIQNMTWGGTMGFQERPKKTLFIPYHSNEDLGTLAAAGDLGVWHAERGLTYFETPLSGHFVGRDTPSISFRVLEVLLGRVKDLGSREPFTSDR
ncbi:carboxypeptidase [Colletotrichum truncatum]|uniref:Carboxypeptidase n=1 Tax=Colletotrichum truncatum TaxID=5467 RepID=A0ACC3YKF9_COLTU|nr:carboxypeptidase [Colletotrichum truncatum]KAF6797437.1 carboxypeptidase [Colletotrichum truncatum]